jgi:hypothetical protein
MEALMRRLLVGLFLLGMLGGAQAQTGVHAGMVRVQATFSLGLLNARQEYRYFLYTNAEAMLNDHLGLDGGFYVQLGSSKGELRDPAPGRHTDMRAHCLLFGPNYHFRPGKPLDVYAGVQPGLHLVMEPAPFGIGPAYDHVAVAPAASVVGGLAYYGSFFHLFGQARGIWGNGVTGSTPYGISELRLSFGLGFNFN